MDWARLFERAGEYDVTLAQVRETLATHRGDGDG